MPHASPTKFQKKVTAQGADNLTDFYYFFTPHDSEGWESQIEDYVNEHWGSQEQKRMYASRLRGAYGFAIRVHDDLEKRTTPGSATQSQSTEIPSLADIDIADLDRNWKAPQGVRLSLILHGGPRHTGAHLARLEDAHGHDHRHHEDPASGNVHGSQGEGEIQDARDA